MNTSNLASELNSSEPTFQKEVFSPNSAFISNRPEDANPSTVPSRSLDAIFLDQPTTVTKNKLSIPVTTAGSIASNASININVRNLVKDFYSDGNNTAYRSQDMWKNLVERRKTISFKTTVFLQLLSNAESGVVIAFMNDKPAPTQLAGIQTLTRPTTGATLFPPRNRTSAVANTNAAVNTGAQNWPAPAEGYRYETLLATANRLTTSDVKLFPLSINNNVAFIHESLPKTCTFLTPTVPTLEYPTSFSTTPDPGTSTLYHMIVAPWYMFFPNITLRLTNTSGKPVSYTLDVFSEASGPQFSDSFFPPDYGLNNSFLFRYPLSDFTQSGAPRLETDTPLSGEVAAAFAVADAVVSFAVNKTNAQLARVGITPLVNAQTSNSWSLRPMESTLPDESDQFFFTKMKFLAGTHTISYLTASAYVNTVSWGNLSNILTLATGITHSVNTGQIMWLLRLNQFSAISFDYHIRYHVTIPAISDTMSYNLLFLRIPYERVHQAHWITSSSTGALNKNPMVTKNTFFKPVYPTTSAAIPYADIVHRVSGAELQKMRNSGKTWSFDVPCIWPFSSGHIPSNFTAKDLFVPAPTEDHVFIVEPTGLSAIPTTITSNLQIIHEVVVTNIKRANPAFRNMFPSFPYNDVRSPMAWYKTTGPNTITAATTGFSNPISASDEPMPKTFDPLAGPTNPVKTGRLPVDVPLSAAYEAVNDIITLTDLPYPTTSISKPSFMGADDDYRKYISSEFIAGAFRGTANTAFNGYNCSGTLRSTPVLIAQGSMRNPIFSGGTLPQFIFSHFLTASGPVKNRVVFDTNPAGLTGYVGVVSSTSLDFSNLCMFNGYGHLDSFSTATSSLCSSLYMTGAPVQVSSAGHFTWEFTQTGACNYYPLSTSAVDDNGVYQTTDPVIPEKDRFYDRLLTITADIAGDTIFTVNKYAFQHSQSFAGNLHQFIGFAASIL